MAKNIEDFRDQLSKFAEAIEIFEKTFIKNGDIDIKVSLNEDTLNDLIYTLNNTTKDNKCIISIGNVNFTFLKK